MSVAAERLGEAKRLAEAFRADFSGRILGQAELGEALLLALCGGHHLLIEGPPGTAKTSAALHAARSCDFGFSRIQFTPDLLPSDLLGAVIYHPGKGEFETRRGPIFTEVLLADEINRAPGKVQSALLEAMQERQVTLAGESAQLGAFFTVIATQNPLENEGTHPLPEAQLDRFALKLLLRHPAAAAELEVLRGATFTGETRAILRKSDVSALRVAAGEVHFDDRLLGYLHSLVAATRDPSLVGLDPTSLRFGVSTRGALVLRDLCRLRALLRGQGWVTLEDVRELAVPAFRHRIGLSFESEADGESPDTFLAKILAAVKAP